MRQIVTLLITVFLIGCSNKIKNLDGFKLLPSVQKIEYNNDEGGELNVVLSNAINLGDRETIRQKILNMMSPLMQM